MSVRIGTVRTLTCHGCGKHFRWTQARGRTPIWCIGAYIVKHRRAGANFPYRNRVSDEVLAAMRAAGQRQASRLRAAA